VACDQVTLWETVGSHG